MHRFGEEGIFEREVNWFLLSVSYRSGSVNRSLSYVFFLYLKRTLQGRYEFPHSDKGANWRSESLANLSNAENITARSYNGLGLKPGSVLVALWQWARDTTSLSFFVPIYGVIVRQEQGCSLCTPIWWVPDPSYVPTKKVASARAVILRAWHNHDIIITTLRF